MRKKSTQSLMKQWRLVTSVSIYISPDGGVSVSVFPWPDEETLRNMRASGLISHNDYRTRLGLSPMKD